MITRLKIEKLFGRFDYDLVFKDRVTILTGPNGFGKSTVLRILEALGSGNVYFFTNLMFLSVGVWFDNDVVEIKNYDKYIVFGGFEIPKVRYYGSIDWNKTINHTVSKNEIMHTPINQVDYRLIQKGRAFVEGKFIEETIESFCKKIAELCGNIVVISEQRLIDLNTGKDEIQMVTEVVTKKPKEMKREIDNVRSAFAKKASEEDAKLPKRINKGERITEGQYKEFQKQLNDRFDKLRIYNLTNEPTQSEPYQESTSASMNAFFRTNINKYTVYDTLLNKLDLFVGIVNNRLMFKYLEISGEKGFEIIDETTGNPLALDQLSSGEKQVIVMYYDLIFNDNENLLLLIDEPEISMHISWQSKFMEDLIRIAEHGNFRAIVATHSPDIINGLWDLQIDLGEQYQGNLYGEDEGESHGD